MRLRAALALLLANAAALLDPDTRNTTVRCACGTYWRAPHDVAVRAFGEHLRRGTCKPHTRAVPGVYGPRQGTP